MQTFDRVAKQENGQLVVRSPACPNVYLKKTKHKGWGVFASRDFRPGEVLTGYGGRVIGREEHLDATRANRGQYILWLDVARGMGLDSKPMDIIGQRIEDFMENGFFGGFVNEPISYHLSTKLEDQEHYANARLSVGNSSQPLRKGPSPKEPLGCIVALKPIRKDEEITTYYGSSYRRH